MWFGEVHYKDVRAGGVHQVYVKAYMDSFPDEVGVVRAVDCSSVVAILRKLKLIRRRNDHSVEESRDLHPFYYLVVTPAGYAELAKHPEQWNE